MAYCAKTETATSVPVTDCHCLCAMLQRLDTDEDFLSIIGIWRDTLTDESS
jgi:hypothetical protein